MPKLYHINDNGVAPCGAKKGNCPYKGEEGSPENHFEDPVEAMRVFESRLENEYGTTNSVSKKDTLEPESRRLAANGGTPKQIRDALRRENPTWGNPQVHTVQRRMTEELGSKKEPQDLTKALSDSIAMKQAERETKQAVQGSRKKSAGVKRSEVTPEMVASMRERFTTSQKDIEDALDEVRNAQKAKHEHDRLFGVKEGRVFHYDTDPKKHRIERVAGPHPTDPRQNFYEPKPENEQKIKEAHERYKKAVETAKNVQTEIEKAGQGHIIPDDGPVLRVGTQAQKWLVENELKGQISDGFWENSRPNDHWTVWSEARVVVDPANVGRNFDAIKDNYQLNSKSLLDVVGDRMIEDVKKETGEDYDQATMNKDLTALRTMFKTRRERIQSED